VPFFTLPVSAFNRLIRTNNTGAAQCEIMAEFVGQQGLKAARVNDFETGAHEI
jgi:hypothetical protein